MRSFFAHQFSLHAECLGETPRISYNGKVSGPPPPTRCKGDFPQGEDHDQKKLEIPAGFTGNSRFCFSSFIGFSVCGLALVQRTPISCPVPQGSVDSNHSVFPAGGGIPGNPSGQFISGAAV
jgi:hypothetical protein